MNALNLQAVTQPPDEANVLPALSKLMLATKDIFGGEVAIYESCDPEFPADKYIVFAAETRLRAEQIVEAETAWILALQRTIPTAGDIRLNIVLI